jgi:serine/threonine-protein kinase
MIQVPTGLTGLTFEEAKQRLVDAGFNAASITPVDAQDEPSTAKADSVVKVSPAEGTQAAATDIITLSVATGRATVPYVRGMTYDSAVSELRTAGFTKFTREDQVSTDASLSAGQVITTRPAADTRVDKTATVTIIVAKDAPSPSPSPTSSSPSASPSSSPTSTP